MESMGKKPRRRRSFTPEFKAGIVGLCQQGDRSADQVARDFDLTETAVREWVRQAERDAGTRSDGGLTSTEQQELTRLRRENRRLREDVDPQAGHGFLRSGDPVSVYPFIEAEKAQQHSVKRACELLEVSRAAFYQQLAGPVGAENCVTLRGLGVLVDQAAQPVPAQNLDTWACGRRIGASGGRALA